MATSVTISGSTYSYTISNIQNALTVTPSNRSQHYGEIYAKPTIKRNKSGTANKRYFYFSFDPYGSYDIGIRVTVEYRATFTKNGTTATVDEVNRSYSQIMSLFAYSLNAKRASSASNIVFRVYASEGELEDYWTYSTGYFSETASGWTQSAPTAPTYTLTQNEANDPDPTVFGYVVGFAKASWSTTATSPAWGALVLYKKTTLTADGESITTDWSNTTDTVSLASKVVNSLSVTATARAANTLGGSATSSNVLTVQPYNKPTINTLSISRTSATRSQDSAVISVGWIIDALNKQSTETTDIKTGAVTASWVSVDLQYPNTEYASGSFDIISDGDSVTTLVDQTDEIAQDANRTRAHDTYDSNHTYRFTVTLTDRLGQSSEPIPAILNSKFFLISAKAGGKGIGFGMAPLNEGFHVKMPATFYDDIDAEISELSGVYSGGLNDKAVMTDDTVLDWQTILNTQTADRGLIDQILAKFADDHKYDCDWTDLPMSSTAKVYSTDQKPRYKRYGHIVQVYGAVAPKAQVAAGGSLTIATLPQHYRPPRSNLMILCQGSANNKWVLYMGYDGVMLAQRYSTGGTAAAMPTSAWLPFSVTFLV